MTTIVELAPVYAEATNPEFTIVQGIWNSRVQAEQRARAEGHEYLRPADGGVDREEIETLLARADAVILAPTTAAAAGMSQPTDGEEAGREIGHRLLDRLATDRPDLHIVLVSHFLVGHGVGHRNAKPNTWSLRAVEAHLRGGRNPWTILRPTWLSTLHDESYQTRLTQDQHADGLVSTHGLADAVLTAIERPELAAGRTAAVFNLSIPDTGSTDLAAQFAALRPDFEATRILEPVLG
ncbi:hypothetical protein B7C42_00032 [Nocardia cerradoensis]|uniref:NAD(P)-binding domain-containing protein n=1 Tax=Nocardia cerradoensis TaxID=85688 RepID=A0A231HDS7_9NOCA|nr:NAD(P)H-binding protein [Nocardia cerradoensis]OXR46918.1 hypothetical protein B7C42_00032 [Nocardia cerradoensis]